MTKRLKCVRACQVKSFGIVQRDAVIELDEQDIDDRICGCFVDAESGDKVTTQASGGLASLTKEELAFRAERLGIPVGSRMTKAELLSAIQAAEETVKLRA